MRFDPHPLPNVAAAQVTRDIDAADRAREKWRSLQDRRRRHARQSRGLDWPATVTPTHRDEVPELWPVEDT